MNFLYLALLGACLLGTLPLEIVLRTRVYARWRRLLATVVPVVVVFGGWDVAEIVAGHWTYDRRQTTGIVFGRLPLEELLFFVVVPICAVLTLEAVRAVRGWRIGDEPVGR